jgi:radical SAM protein with 4Fe4S-binding SPASM domain
MKRPRVNLDMGLFEKAVQEFAGAGGGCIDFSVCIGEPLLDPYLLKRVRFVKSFDNLKGLGFVTTLQELNSYDLAEFIDAGIDWLNISSVFSGKQKYKEFFGTDNYEQTLDNIINLLEENKKRGNKINISFDIKPTEETISEIKSSSDFKLIDRLTDGHLSKRVDAMSICVDDWIGNVQLPGYLKKRKRPLYPRVFRPCSLFYNKLIVYSNGKIGICSCRDFNADSEMILGDIREIGILEAWASEKINNLRRNWRLKNVIPEICRKCSAYSY